ncbi:MAG: amidohydrolase [Acidimicrobiia bacterium]|nr:amidohydrolase [Acidimicrobiia bacterium]
MTGKIIDVHSHIVPPRLAEKAQQGGRHYGLEFGRDEHERVTSSSGGGAPFALPWPTPLETPTERIGSMDAVGVDVHLLSLSPSMHWYDVSSDDGRALAVDTNDDIAEIVASHPDRFRGLAFLPLQDPAAAVDELERCVRELGFAGTLVGTNVNGLDWDAPELFPILAAARDLDALVFVHPARGRGNPFMTKYHLKNLIGNPMETSIALASLIFGGVLDRLGDVKLCFAHGGGYGCLGIARMDHGYRVRSEAQGIAQMPSDYLRGLYFDSLVHGHRTLDQIIDLAGIDQIVLGSDYPADMGEPDPVGFIRSHPTMPEADQSKILSHNLTALIGG